MTEEYKRSCEDELDWSQVEQLHEATLQISNSCFEFKKLCVGLIGVALAILTKLAPDKLNHAFFIVPLLICFGFWIADFTAYYYQRSTRNLMKVKLLSIAKRNKINDYPSKELAVSWGQAAFNLSMSLYFALGAIGLFGWMLFAHNAFSS